MNNSKPSSGVGLVAGIVSWIEITCTVVLVIGIGMIITSGENTLMTVALPGLALCYFLYAYVPLPITKDENQSRGFGDLLATSIIPKLLWIGSAVATMGLFFEIMKMEGGAHMLLISVLSLSSCVVFLMVFGIMGKPVRAVLPILLRALPVLAVALYFLLSAGRV